MVTIGFNTRSIGEERTVREAVDFAVENGIRALELDGRHLWQQFLSGDEIRHMKVQAARHGIQYAIHFPQDTNPATHDPERRARHLTELEDTMHLAHEIGARVIVIHLGHIECPGVDPTEASEAVRQQAIENSVEFLRKATSGAEEAGVVLCVENVFHGPGNVLQTYDELVDVVRRVESSVIGITLDTGHAHLTDGVDAAFEAFRPHLRHLHIHDCVGHAQGDDHREVGSGDADGRLDLASYAHILRTASYIMTLEVGRSAVLALEAGEDPLGCVTRSVDAVKAMLGDLAQ